METYSETTDASATMTEDTSFWKKHIEGHRSSKLSRAAYCRQQGINYDRFQYWHKKLTSPSKKLIPVTLKRTQSHNVICTIEMAKNCRVLVHDHVALQTIIKQLT